MIYVENNFIYDNKKYYLLGIECSKTEKFNIFICILKKYNCVYIPEIKRWFVESAKLDAIMAESKEIDNLYDKRDKENKKIIEYLLNNKEVLNE